MATRDLLTYCSDTFIEMLSEEGDRIARECEQNRTYTHRTSNLKDSYGWGVYHNGKLSKQGFLTPTPSATVPRRLDGKDVYGRDEIETYLQNYKATAQYELIVFAAMPYAGVLESKGYRVISVAHKLLSDLGVGTVVPINS